MQPNYQPTTNSQELDNYGIIDNTNDDSYEVLRMDEHQPLNDSSCTHDNLIPDPTDTIGDAVYHGCQNRKCGMGFYIQNKNFS